MLVEKVEQVNVYVERGITVNGLFESVLPLMQPTTRITLSKLPPLISDEFMVRELSNFPSTFLHLKYKFITNIISKASKQHVQSN